MASAAATISSNKAHPTHIAESDTIIVSGLTKMAAAAASLYEDNFTTSIVIGGGSNLTTGDTITVNAGAGDLRFDARNMTTPLSLNQADDVDLNAAFAAQSVTSLVKALNSLQDGTVAIAGAGGTLTLEILTGQIQVDGDQVLTLSNNVSATGIKILFVRGIAYFAGEGIYTVSGANNEVWTWENDTAPFTLLAEDRIAALYIAE